MYDNIRLPITFIFIFFFAFQVYSQSKFELQGRIVQSETDIPIPQASIQIGDKTTSSDSHGRFQFEQIKPGKYQIEISAMGYKPYIESIVKISSENLVLEIELLEKTNEIDGITIIGTSESKKIQQAPIRAIVIDTRAISTQASTLTDIMNQSPGIRIRQNGGLGNTPDISINGFQGKAIKYFKDGIPLDYLGEGYNLSSVPMELLDRVEVYKGVLPISLGADALGGAINLVSHDESIDRKQVLKGYYEIGSFQTHRIGLIHSNSSKNRKWTYGLEGFYNYSANNYKAWVPVVDTETKNIVDRRLPFFHNGYKHFLGNAFLSIKNRNWVDELKFAATGFTMQKEQQHPALLTDAYGELHSAQSTISPSIRYKKSFNENRIRIDQFVSYNNLHSQRIDTLKGYYDWYGEFFPRTTIGESRLASQSSIHEKQWLSRSNLSFLISPYSKMEFNYVFNDVQRKGTDPYGAKLQNSETDVLQIPSYYQKHSIGISLDQYFFDNRLQNQLMGKAYAYNTSGIQNTWLATDITNNDRRQSSGFYWGASEALKYQINSSSFLRTSLELTYRLPEREEIFGNQVFIVSNFELAPEKSLNVNLGYQGYFWNRLLVEANSFYRNTKNLILLVPIQAPNAQYQNQDQVRGYGFDLDFQYQINKQYQILMNTTWQNLRLFGIENLQDVWKNDARLRNTPYFFGNIGAKAKYGNLIQQDDQFHFLFNYNFMREFYLETIPKNLEPGGFLGLTGSAQLNTKLIIPNQHLFTASFQYEMANKHLVLAGELRNIFNKDIYDFYRIPRPGRSVNFKITYKL